VNRSAFVASPGRVKTPSVEGEFNLTITTLFIVIFCSDSIPLSVIKHIHTHTHSEGTHLVLLLKNMTLKNNICTDNVLVSYTFSVMFHLQKNFHENIKFEN